MAEHRTCIAFQGETRIANGDIAAVALAAKRALAGDADAPLVIFDAATSEPVEIDCRGSDEDVLRRLPPAQPEPARGPGRPKLGVVAREVTLLPRHWDWLNGQSGGASVALRKLVEHALRANAGTDRIRMSQNAAYKFMSAMAGNRVGFEDAARALFAGDAAAFGRYVAAWPPDIRDHVNRLAADALQTNESAS